MLYEILNQLEPYFFSIRKREKIILLDLTIPYHWEYSNVLKKYETLSLSVEDSNGKKSLITIMSELNEDGVKNIIDCTNELIKYNQEKEEKERLLKEKIRDLQNLFENSDIEDLKNLNFNGEQQREEVNQLVREGSGEGQSGSGDSQEEDDRGN